MDASESVPVESPECAESVESRRTDVGWAAGVFAGSLVLLCVGLGWGLDRDIAIAGGERMLRGEWPYRDFWTLYAPGSSAAVAATFALFGRELIALHAVAAVAAAAANAAFFALLRTAGLVRPGALAACGVFAVAVWSPSPALDSYALPRVLLLIGWERVLRALRAGEYRPLFAAGLAFGAAAVFKHDVAGYAAAGSALAIVLARVPALAPRVALARLAAGCACCVVPAVVAVASVGGADAWQQLIVFPATDFASVRGEPYPGWLPPLGSISALLSGPRDLRAIGGLVSVLAEWGQAIAPQALLLAWVVQAVLRRRIVPASWLAVASLPFFWAAAHVQQNTHLFTMAVLSSLLAVDLWRRERSSAFRALLALLVLGLAASFVAPAGLRSARMWLEQPGARELGLPGTRGIRVPAREYAVLVPIAALLRQRVPPGEPIHVALGRHDAIVIGDPRFYFLADRPAATRYHELHPGVADRADVQREIIQALEAQRVRAVVVWNFGWPARRLDEILARRRRSLPDLGARELDDYLRERFARIARHGEYDVLWRRPALDGSDVPFPGAGAGVRDGPARPVAD